MNAKSRSEPILKYKMDYDRFVDPERIDESVLRPLELSVGNLIYYRRISSYAHKEVAWHKISERIVQEVQDVVETEFGHNKIGNRMTLRQNKMNFGKVQTLVEKIQIQIIDKLANELNKKSALLLQSGLKGRIF